jgi:hypothetical protein
MSRAAERPKAEPEPGDVLLRPGGAAVFVEEEDAEWGRVRHYRTVDTLGLMLKAGTISQGMHDAGRQFQEDFLRAFRSGYASPRLDGLPAGTRLSDGIAQRSAAAALAVREALDAAGGATSPAGSGLWHVVGLGMSVREWVQRADWSGYLLTQHTGMGALIAGLAMLCRHYGYRP